MRTGNAAILRCFEHGWSKAGYTFGLRTASTASDANRRFFSSRASMASRNYRTAGEDSAFKFFVLDRRINLD